MKNTYYNILQIHIIINLKIIVRLNHLLTHFGATES